MSIYTQEDDELIDNAACAAQSHSFNEDSVLKEAVKLNCIAPLRERIKELEALLGKWMCHDGHVCPSCGMPDNRMQELEAELQQCLDCCKVVGELEAENKRLREALQEIAKKSKETSYHSSMVPYWEFVDYAEDIAVKALEAEDEKETSL